MQSPSIAGLRPAKPEERRFDVVPIHGASKHMGEALRLMWADRTPTEAHALLKEPDVVVTNQSDKDVQLRKLLELDEEIRQVMSEFGQGTDNKDNENLPLPARFPSNALIIRL